MTSNTAFLRIFKGETLIEQRELSAQRTTLGRASDNDIVLPGRGVSKHHAVIERDEFGYIFVDLDSSNGSYIGKKRVRQRVLSYWDEICIPSYVMKFMAVARARGEEVGASKSAPAAPAKLDETMALNVADIGEMVRLRRRAKTASVDVRRAGHGLQRQRLDHVNFTIGKAVDNDVFAGGWLAPSVVARIQRRNDGFYLLPSWLGRVRLNGKRVRQQTKLDDGDEISAQGVALQFHYRHEEGV